MDGGNKLQAGMRGIGFFFFCKKR